MSAGTSLPVVKAALETVLELRAGLAGVPVTDSGPVNAENLQNDSGAWEGIWLGDAIAPEITIPVLGVPVVFDEAYDLDVVIQVLKRVTDAGNDAITQTLADTRCAALLGEVIGACAAAPGLAVAATAAYPLGVEALPRSWEHAGGWIGRGQEYGSRFVLKLRVTARIAIT